MARRPKRFIPQTCRCA